jgi:sensor histidine kinase regulating citrate/malate metabolism
MSIVLLNYLERQQAMVLDNAILRQSLKIESEHIRSLQESYSSQRKQTHDFNNQLAVLRSMAEHNAPQEDFSEYLSHILAIEFPPIIYVNTHRMVVDIILSQKCTFAKNKKIDLELRLDDLSNFPLPDDALVIVLTNLIDNAMEACEKILTPSQRKIILTMHVKPMVSFLRIENTTAEPVHISNNTIATTKTDSFAHGYGLKNVCTMLERHGGTYAMAYREDGTFCFSSKISTNG